MALPDPAGFVIRFLIGSGLRWGEAVRAVTKRRDAKDTVYIEGGAVVVSRTKSKRVRSVPLPSALLAEIRTRIGPLRLASPARSGASQAQRVGCVGALRVHSLPRTLVDVKGR